MNKPLTLGPDGRLTELALATIVGNPGSDNTLVTEQAIRETVSERALNQQIGYQGNGEPSRQIAFSPSFVSINRFIITSSKIDGRIVVSHSVPSGNCTDGQTRYTSAFTVDMQNHYITFVNISLFNDAACYYCLSLMGT